MRIILIPHDTILLIEMRLLIRDSNLHRRLHHLLRTEPPLIARDPQRRQTRLDARLVVGVDALLLRALDLDVLAPHFPSQRRVVAVEVRVEPLPGGGPAAACLVGVWAGGGAGADVGVGVGAEGVLFGFLGSFFGVECAGEERVEWLEGVIEGHVG